MSFHAVDWFTVGGSLASATAIFVSLWTFKKQKKSEEAILLEQKNREIQALKKVFIRECELNNYAIYRMKEYGSLLEEKANQFRVEVSNFRYRGVFLDENNQRIVTGGIIPKVYNKTFYSNLLTAAKLDDALFLKLELACDAVSELDHMVTSMIEYSLNEKENFLLDGLGSYITSNIDYEYDKLNELYQYCSGVKLENTRLR
ncbi:TPA: hypothetical protein OUC37_000553 [Proteus mirabilis]|nr:hypothetical protein [Proteus mirabilis]